MAPERAGNVGLAVNGLLYARSICQRCPGGPFGTSGLLSLYGAGIMRAGHKKTRIKKADIKKGRLWKGGPSSILEVGSVRWYSDLPHGRRICAKVCLNGAPSVLSRHLSPAQL